MEELAERRDAQFKAEIERIETNGVEIERCDYCDSADKRCLMVLERKDRQRAPHCLECYKRSKKCSHALPGSNYQLKLKRYRQKADLARGALGAILAKEEEDEVAAAERAEREERRRIEEVSLKKQELAVRADEAFTQREVTKTQRLMLKAAKTKSVFPSSLPDHMSDLGLGATEVSEDDLGLGGPAESFLPRSKFHNELVEPEEVE